MIRHWLKPDRRQTDAISMTLFIDLLIFLLLARSLGAVTVKFGLPGSVGEILAGVMVTVVAINFAGEIPYAVNLVHSEVLVYSAEIGIFCLMLLSGIDTEINEIRAHSLRSLAIAIGGTLVPLGSGFALIWIMLPGIEHRLPLALLTGIVMSVTAVPAIAKVLQELDLVHSRLGQVVIGAALFDDVIGLFLLAVLMSVIQTGGFPGVMAVVILLLKVIAFFVITMNLGVHVYPRVSRHLNTMQATSLEFSAMAIVGLAYGLFAEWLGLHWVIGAFVAGLFFDRKRVGIRSYSEVKLIFTAVTRGMLAPLFFASIGVRFDPNSLLNAPGLLLLLLTVAFLGKIIGCGIPAKLSGLSRREACGVGVAMSTRGAVGFIVLSVAFSAGLFDTLSSQGTLASNLFSGLVLVGVVTTMLVPVMLKSIYPGRSGNLASDQS